MSGGEALSKAEKLSIPILYELQIEPFYMNWARIAVVPSMFFQKSNLLDIRLSDQIETYFTLKTCPSSFEDVSGSVDASSVDLDHVRNCLQFCKTHHSRACRHDQNIPQITVIDCNTRDLVHLGAGNDYVSLSYVWGDSTPQVINTHDNILPEKVEQTIEDAMQISKSLGIAYLWVDRYCIP